MLTYKEILFATTKLLSDAFSIDVIVDDTEGIFDKECFYVSIVPLSVQVSTSSTDKKELMISVKYFGGNKLKCYEVANELNNLLNRVLKVNDRSLIISNTEPNIFKDEIGCVLDFLVYITYFDDIKQDKESYENMENVEIRKER